MEQASEHQDWADPENWGHGAFGLYFSKRDPRLWVPKRNPRRGWTVNLGHPKGGLAMFGILLLAALLPIVLIAGMTPVCTSVSWGYPVGDGAREALSLLQ